MNEFGYETWGEKAKRKFNENPWVPLGCFATCGALVMSALKMRSGESQKMNYWLRTRVVLQGVTLVALVAGSMVMKARKNEITEATGIGEGLPRNEQSAEIIKEQKREKEREEFEERLKGAQEAHDTEVRIRKGVRMVPTVEDSPAAKRSSWWWSSSTTKESSNKPEESSKKP